MLRRTKIVATMGPATDDPKVLDEIIQAGVDVVRLNFSHGTPEEQIERAENVRNRARAHGRQVGVIADLQGPKIRIEKFKNGEIFLREGATFTLDARLGVEDGSEEAVGITYKQLPSDVTTDQIVTRVVAGGELSNNKGINRQGGGLSAKALTEKDRADIKVAAKMEVDYLAVSFPRTAADVEEARKLLRDAGGHGGIIAKVERAEAIDNIEEIMEASDVIMIARGDLGVEIGDAELTGVQKQIIRQARNMDRVVITATQMMQSMVDSQIPTRAEVFDVANAVLDGTDAVMLSAETAVGKYPAMAVAAMDRICRGAERQKARIGTERRSHTKFHRIDEAIAKAAMYTANHLGVKAIASLTESGATTLWMSRISSGIPIYAMTQHVASRRKVTLYRGVYPVSFEVSSMDLMEVNREIIDELVRRGAVRDGDLVIITKGDMHGVVGGTNSMKIVRVGELAEPQ
jgi:pyruvate kinase